MRKKKNARTELINALASITIKDVSEEEIISIGRLHESMTAKKEVAPKKKTLKAFVKQDKPNAGKALPAEMVSQKLEAEKSQ